MGVYFHGLNSFNEYNAEGAMPECEGQVLSLVRKSLEPLIAGGIPSDLRHVIVATSCPDKLAPSVGQKLSDEFNPYFGHCQVIDIVQGCAGGVSAMVLGSQLAEHERCSSLVIQVDAARKATSTTKSINRIFGNGSFSCLVSHTHENKGLIHHKSHHYKGLSDVVTVSLGHDADKIIMSEHEDMLTDPRKHLGLSLNKSLALRLLKHAERFYKEFVLESMPPELMILHQVNPQIISVLKSVFNKYPVEFINVSQCTGNCGAATVGIAMDKVKSRLDGKKIMLCSFGTGGVITAGLWQN